MKRLSFITLILASVFSACQGPIEPTGGPSVVVIPEGAVQLRDTKFGMYYGDVNNDGTGVFSLVLSDALCYQDKLGSPYMDSEGDMLVLQVRTPLLASDAAVVLPAGEYSVSEEVKENIVFAPESYVTRMTGSTQVRWAVKSGLVSVAKGDKGDYTIVAEGLVIEKGNVIDTVDYYCSSSIVMSDYMEIAPTLLGDEDDIVNVPFPYMSCTYYGQIYGAQTGGNFLANMATKDFVVMDENGNEVPQNIPGVCVVFNFFSKVYAGGDRPYLKEGHYFVSTFSADELGKEGTIMPGTYYDASTPFGTYLIQQTASGESVLEFISGGYVDVEYPEAENADSDTKYCVMTYSLNTSKRVIKGVWKGEMPVNNLAETSNDSYLTTLDQDVVCDMSKVTGGTLRKIETIRREQYDIDNNDIGYDVAEAWQLYLQPRDWTDEEKDIDYNQDLNGNGISDRLDAWCPDGDYMILEFILPLESGGVIAPELNKTYVYTMQPSLAMTADMYEIYVSQMGRPANEIFDIKYALDHPGWAQPLGLNPNDPATYDRTSARRGFTWAIDGFRGNWYMHYETNRYYVMDEHAPAINGTVKVTRTGMDVYDFEWDFIDDYPGSPNKITGSIQNCKVKIQMN